MIERYSYPYMSGLWTEEAKFNTWLKVEVLAAEAWCELGRVPREALNEIKARAGFDVHRIHAIEATTNHDVIAFLTSVAEHVGDSSKYIHLGMTSSDVVDTAFSYIMKQAADHIIEDIDRAIAALRDQAARHKYTLMIGRTHGIHAEPTTLGLKLLIWIAEMERARDRIEAARETIGVGKISGPVGTYAGIPPQVEAHVCRSLGLKPARVSSQIVQRDRHAEYMCALALAGSSIEKFATEIRSLQRTEIGELQEPFGTGQKGSSAMPHKRNPIISERLCGLARVLRANAMVAMENVALWHERDISHSSAERIIVPDSTILLDYMLRKFTSTMENLIVRPKRMAANLELTGGLICSGSVMLALVDSGMLRERAYEIVQRNAMKAFDEGLSFKELICQDAEVASAVSREEIEQCFDHSRALEHVDTVFQRFGL